MLVLQLQGSKRWFVFDKPARPLPLPDETCRLGVTAADGPYRELDLRAADLLYIPRGHLHQAFCVESASLHVSVTLKPPNWLEVMQSALEAHARCMPRLRRSVPFGYLHDDTQTAAELLKILAALPGELDAVAAVSANADRFVAGRLTYPGSQFDPPAVPADTPLQRRSDMFCRVVEAANYVTLVFPGVRLTFPPSYATALHLVSTAPLLLPSDLRTFLSESDATALIRQLVERGLLVPCGGTHASISPIEEEETET